MGGGGQGACPPPLENKNQKKKAFQILGPPPYEFLDRACIISGHLLKENFSTVLTQPSFKPNKLEA